MALRAARAGDVVAEMSCRCGKALVLAEMASRWACERGHRGERTGRRFRVTADGLVALASREQR